MRVRKPYVHVVHLGLDEDQHRKLRTLALLSRRTQLGVLRLLLDDATPEQVGGRQPKPSKPKDDGQGHGAGAVSDP